MEFVLLRHGQPEWVRDGLCVIDPPLNENGFAQAEHLGEALQREHFDEFLVSPLLRARQTAVPLATKLGREPEIVHWLEECREPDWHGEPAEVSKRAYATDRLQAPQDRWNGVPGGESMRDFTNRIHRGLAELLAAHGITRVPSDLPVWDIEAPGRRIAWVAHGGTNTVTISHLLGLQPVPWEWDRFVIGHASICRLIATPVGKHFTFSLTRLSGVEHLPESLRTF